MRERLKRIEIRLNKKEYNQLEKQLTITGLTQSDFLRSLIMKTNIQPAPQDELIKTYRLISNLANNTNQIARVANSTGYINPDQIENLLAMVDKCWQQIKKIS